MQLASTSRLLRGQGTQKSNVLQVSHDYFENAMAFFTKTIYNAIMVSVSGGDVSPLVGHNAFLRWSLMKECAFQDGAGQTKYWSEAHVSEDFDIAIRFQVSHCRLSPSCLRLMKAHRMISDPCQAGATEQSFCGMQCLYSARRSLFINSLRTLI